jgi:hypothetical protein
LVGSLRHGSQVYEPCRLGEPRRNFVAGVTGQ